MWRRKGETMDLRRSRWILGVVLASIAVAGTPAGADEPNFTEDQKIDFLQHAKVIASKPEKKGKSDALRLTLSDGKVTYDASFQPIDERRFTARARTEGRNSILEITGDTTLPAIALRGC